MGRRVPVPQTTRPWRVAGLCLVWLLAFAPLLGDDLFVFRSGILVITLITVLGLHILVNWAGELSLAHASATALPAFVVLACSDLWNVSPVYLIPLGIGVGAIAGTVIGLPALRSSGLQVALVTLIAGFAIDHYFLKQLWLVGNVPRQVATPMLGPIDLSSRRDQYLLLIACAAVAMVLVKVLHESKVGRGWRWVRANQDAAAAFGVPVALYRLLGYAVGGAFAGLAGALFANWVRTFGGQAFPPESAFSYLLLAVIAGAGMRWNVLGAVLAINGGQLIGELIFGTDVGDFLDTLIAYAGPIGLIAVIVQHPEGLGGAGRALLQGRAPAPPERTAERSAHGATTGVAS